MELAHLTRIAKMPGEQVARINAKMQESCKENELLNIEANLRLRTTQAAQRQIENLCNLFST
jgi:hypothetical protein